MYWLLVAVFLWAVAIHFLRREIAAAWAEPCLRHPVMVFEGDDWGYGPLEQADAIEDARPIQRIAGTPRAIVSTILLRNPYVPSHGHSTHVMRDRTAATSSTKPVTLMRSLSNARIVWGGELPTIHSSASGHRFQTSGMISLAQRSAAA